MVWMPIVLAACIKAPPVAMAPEPIDLPAVAVLGSYGESAVGEMPESVVARVREVAAARKITLVEGEIPGSFETVRDAESRRSLVDGLLVSCDPRFDVQVNGRYRWLVPCDVALGSVVKHVEPNALLVYYHQDEADAVSDVAMVLEREVARVLDQWLAAESVSP